MMASAGMAGPLEWADETLAGIISAIKSADGNPVIPREFLAEMAQAAALVGIGWELRKIRRALTQLAEQGSSDAAKVAS